MGHNAPMDDLLYWLGIAAVGFSALTGALDAGRKQMDLVGLIMVGSATALGGGTVRDILLDRRPFWLADEMNLVVAMGTAALCFFVARRARLPPRLFLVPDAIGLALFTVVGTQIALQYSASWLAASLLGVITGVVGGVLRDVLCNEVPLLFMRGELYATAAWLGALSLLALQALGVAPVLAAWVAMALIVALRAVAVIYRIRVPTFREKGG